MIFPISSRLLAGFCVVVGLLSVSSAALAQAALTAPETYNPIDANGVNLLGGSFSPTTPSVTIGPKGGGLSYSQTYDINIGDWRESSRGAVTTSTLVYSSGPDPWYTVTVLGQAIAFKRTGDTFAASEGDSTTLVLSGGIYTLTSADGTVATFSTAVAGVLGSAAEVARITQVVQPNGRTIDFNYVSALSYGSPTYRLQSITSNDGYQMHFDYASDASGGGGDIGGAWYTVIKATGLNNAVDACGPKAPACVYSRTWPSLTFSWSGADRIVTDALGRATRYLFSGGLLTGVRRPGRASGQDIAVYYTPDQMVERVITDAGTWTYAIPEDYKAGFPASPHQRLQQSATTVTDPLQHTRTVTSLSTLVDDPTQHRVSRLRSVIDVNGKVAWYGNYDTSFRLISVIQAEGNAQGYDFDTRGNITAVKRGGKLGGLQVIASATYPANCTAQTLKTCNRPLTVTDARNNITTYAYDPDSTHGGALIATSPAPSAGAIQPQTRTTYVPFYAWYKNAAGVLTPETRPIYLPTSTSSCATLGPAVGAAEAPCVGTADEIRSTIIYQVGGASAGSNLLPAATTSGGGDGVLSATTAMTYTAAGDISAVDGPLAGTQDTTRTYYNDARQVTDVIGPDPDAGGGLLHRASHTTYAADGQVAAVETGTATNQSDTGPSTFAALQRMVTTYDVGGRKASDSLVVNGVAQTLTQYGYDQANRLICQVVRMNPTATQPTSACTPTLGGDDRVTYTEYDALDRVTKVTTGYGSGSPRVEKTITYTDNGREQTVADGKPTGTADGRGNLTTYEYDEFDRLSKIRYPNKTGGGSSSTDFYSATYDAADNIIQQTRRGGSVVNYSYDALNRLDYRSGVDSWHLYDNLGRPTVTFSGASAERAIYNTYDALGRPSATYDWRDGVWRRSTSETFDLAGRRVSLQWADNFWVSYSRNAAGEVTAIYESGVNPLVGYTYDDLGRRTGAYRGNNAQTFYTYDAAGRLSALNLD
ncbi:RHS repeat protein, partial [Caulobacter sp. AP07]